MKQIKILFTENQVNEFIRNENINVTDIKVIKTQTGFEFMIIFNVFNNVPEIKEGETKK